MKAIALKYADNARLYLTELTKCVYEDRGCENACPDCDEVCDHCVFLHTPIYPDSARICLLDDLVYALEEFEREALKRSGLRYSTGADQGGGK